MDEGMLGTQAVETDDEAVATSLALPSELELRNEEKMSDAISTREGAYIDKIAGMKKAAEIFKMRADLMSTCRKVSMSETNPEDWVLNKDRDGRIMAMPTAPACDKIAELYGINVENIRPTDSNGQFMPDRITDDDGKGGYTLRAWCDAYSTVTGRRIFNVEASRHSKEQFIGRGSDSDLRSAVWTLLRTKSTRVLAGCSRVPESNLSAVGMDTSRCTKGMGFGSSSARSATKVAEEGVVEMRNALRDEIMRRVGGDASTAKDLLREITSFTGRDGNKFQGYTAIDRITKTGMAQAAMQRLKEHAVFGDDAGGK